MSLLIKILLAHFIGDFVLQPDSWVADKVQKKAKSLKLYYHVGIHLLLLIAFILDVKYGAGIAIIIVSHFIIDLWKLYAQSDTDWRKLFWVDQGLHIAVILAVVHYYEPIFTLAEVSQSLDQVLLLILSLVLILWVSSTVIKMLISKWSPDTEDKDEDSLAKAGSFIGKLERLFVFGFVVTGNIQAVGFLLAAKSVFRFGDLKESKDRKLTEYILIGTLLSFGIAMAIGLGYNWARAIL